MSELLRKEFEYAIKDRQSEFYSTENLCGYWYGDEDQWSYDDDHLNHAFRGFLLGRQSSPERVIELPEPIYIEQIGGSDEYYCCDDVISAIHSAGYNCRPMRTPPIEMK